MTTPSNVVTAVWPASIMCISGTLFVLHYSIGPPHNHCGSLFAIVIRATLRFYDETVEWFIFVINDCYKLEYITSVAAQYLCLQCL